MKFMRFTFLYFCFYSAIDLCVNETKMILLKLYLIFKGTSQREVILHLCARENIICYTFMLFFNKKQLVLLKYNGM